jgi:selenocysteine lyase/cysteine desulfurase
MFKMMGVFAEFEWAMIRERVLAGLAGAKGEGKTLGRKRLEETDARKAAAIRSLRANGIGLRRISRELGVGVGTAQDPNNETTVLGRVTVPELRARVMKPRTLRPEGAAQEGQGKRTVQELDPTSVRASPSFFNDQSEIGAMVEALPQ